MLGAIEKEDEKSEKALAFAKNIIKRKKMAMLVREKLMQKKAGEQEMKTMPKQEKDN